MNETQNDQQHDQLPDVDDAPIVDMFPEPLEENETVKTAAEWLQALVIDTPGALEWIRKNDPLIAATDEELTAVLTKL
jgi:hypothetical protein